MRHRARRVWLETVFGPSPPGTESSGWSGVGLVALPGLEDEAGEAVEVDPVGNGGDVRLLPIDTALESVGVRRVVGD